VIKYQRRNRPIVVATAIAELFPMPGAPYESPGLAGPAEKIDPMRVKIPPASTASVLAI
jgi:hypothetical protein